MDPRSQPSLPGRNRSSFEIINPTGLTILVDPVGASLDIVFVHGFNGHPERTWRHRRGDAKVPDENAKVPDEDDESESAEPPSKFRKLNPFSGIHQKNSSSRTAMYWPRQLIQETVPNARVLTFGYDTHVRHMLGPPVSRSTVYDIAWDFLVALEAERRLDLRRPVIFIAHSLGGIVVKEMLRRSSSSHISQPQLHNIFESTIGIMFFGTPHGGADPRGILQHVAEKVIKAAGFSVNKQIVDTLLPSAERLRELRDEFSPMAHQQGWIIHSFQEEMGVHLLGGNKVVEDVSSYLNFPAIETTQHIGRDHMGMCRFTGLEDVEYRKVAAALCRMTNVISREPRRREYLSINEEQRRDLIESLRFDQIDARQMTIKNGHAKTCKWLLRMPEYLDWLDIHKQDEHYGFLWIKGKPGTGKSTLMKFAHSHARQTMKDRIIISFFFNARGEHLEKSTAGMYRSLLLQLLEQAPELQRIFDSLGLTAYSSSGSRQWSVESLKELFQQAVQRLGQSSLACFIDALDECEERQIRDMVSFFEQLGELAVSAGIRFQVCFSSRHYPHISINKGLNLVLEGQEGHNQDITNYLDSELKIGHSKLAEEIRGDLQKKASGVFMWVVLVVEILNKEHDGGRVHVLRQKLRDIPTDLHQLFRQILTRDCYNRDELLLCIQWVLFAKQPLKPEQLYFAILSGVAPEVLGNGNADEITMDVIKKFILNSSKGLAEITKSRTPTVQFIHESVRDFLIKENGLRELFPDLGSNFQGQSHEQLKQCCLNYMSIDVYTRLNFGTPLPKPSSQEATDLRELAIKMFPFLDYAVDLVLCHADIAQISGVDQGDFIRKFPLADWIKLNNLFEKREVRRYTPKASLLYLLAEKNLSNLIRIHPSNLSYLEYEEERYGPPFFAALAMGNQEAVRTFMELEMDQNITANKLRELYSQYCQTGRKQASLGRDFKFLKLKTIPYYVIENGDEILLAFLLDAGKINPNNEDTYKRTPLFWSAEKGLEVVVKLLLETGKVDADSRDHTNRTLLSWAAQNGHEPVVRLLLETGKVDADSRDHINRTPLSWAAQNGHEPVFRLLLETGKVDADSRDHTNRTPFSYAARNGHEPVVRLLLEMGKVDTGLRDYDGRTPLLLAAQNGHEAVVKLLLKTGKADTDLRDNYGRTLLSLAAQNGHEPVVKLLLEMGKVDAGSRDHDGWTPLSLAAQYGHEAVVKLLLEMGKVDADSRDHTGRTPLSWAAQSGHEPVVKLLLETGKVDADLRDKEGRTPLWYAIQNFYNPGKKEVISLLLATGNVDPSATDEHGVSPLSKIKASDSPERNKILGIVLSYIEKHKT